MSKQIEEVMALVDKQTGQFLAMLKLFNEGKVEGGEDAASKARETRASIEAKLRELLPVWQPISTAPRDGTMILLGKEGSEDYSAISTPGFWQEGWDDSIDDMGCDSGFVDVEFQEFSSGRSFGTEEYRRDPVQPTRWMPLNKAPE